MEELVELIGRARTGDSEAYGVLVSRFQDMAYGYAYAILNDFHLAQDAAQEAFIDAYQRLPTLREALAFPAWLKRIVYSRCDRLTRGKRLETTSLEDAAEMASPLPGPAEAAERSEFSRRVQDAVRELPERQRVVTTLFYINGYSHQEIADFLEVPAKTVKSRLHSSRGRLRERMIDMVQDEFKSNALPAGFTQETVDQAVARAGALNKECLFDQAEGLLRGVLAQVPQHPGALKELNRTLMQGRVHNQNRWDLLPELVEQGKTILQTVDDEHVRHEIAATLLAIPAMPEAAAFLEEWIAQGGGNLERVGMLAWAKGCMADYATAEALWQDVLALAERAETDEIVFHIPFAAFALVDCFAESGELPRAQRVARQAWDRCRDLGTSSPEVAAQLVHHRGFATEFDWMMIFHQAQLDFQEVARVLLALCQTSADPKIQATALCIRAWVDAPQAVVADWLDWVGERIAAGQCGMLRSFRLAILRGFQGHWHELAEATYELLAQADTQDAQEQIELWSWLRFDPTRAVKSGDWVAAEEMVRRAIEERGISEWYWRLILMATIRGVPTPPDVVQYVEQKGAASLDDYELNDWYVVAREAAAAGDEAKAFDALRMALSYWSNPPYYYVKVWEADSYWGGLRDHPEFKRAFDEKRERIGPIHGALRYFPGW